MIYIDWATSSAPKSFTDTSGLGGIFCTSASLGLAETNSARWAIMVRGVRQFFLPDLASASLWE